MSERYVRTALRVPPPTCIPPLTYHHLLTVTGVVTHLALINIRPLSPNFLFSSPPVSAFLFRPYQPKYWYLPVVDIMRRLMLTSGLLVISDPIIQLLVALVVSVTFMVTFREWKPFFEVQTDALAYICGIATTYHPHVATTYLALPCPAVATTIPL